MTRKELERAVRLCDKTKLIERSERSRDERYGWVLTIYWAGGGQAIYASLDEVKRATKFHEASISRV
jgi:hypothetical protein